MNEIKITYDSKYFLRLYSILMADDIVKSINNNIEYLKNIIPEIEPMIGFDQKNPDHHLDVWNHTLLALSLSKKDFDIRLILLLHDISKPTCNIEVDGVRHYPNHGVMSGKIAYEVLKRLNFKEDYINEICYYIINHDFKMDDEFINNNLFETQILYQVQSCDALAHHPEKLENRKKYLAEIKNKLYCITNNQSLETVEKPAEYFKSV